MHGPDRTARTAGQERSPRPELTSALKRLRQRINRHGCWRDGFVVILCACVDVVHGHGRVMSKLAGTWTCASRGLRLSCPWWRPCRGPGVGWATADSVAVTLGRGSEHFIGRIGWSGVAGGCSTWTSHAGRAGHGGELARFRWPHAADESSVGRASLVSVTAPHEYSWTDLTRRWRTSAAPGLARSPAA